MKHNGNGVLVLSIRRYSFSTIQAGRGLAALLVVFFHVAGSIFASEKYWGFDPTYNAFAFGHAGVDFFFVLSGFIIFHVHWQDIGQPERVLRYAQKRFVRIYPFYWIVLALIVPVYFLVPSFGKGYEREASLIASSFTLLHFNSDLTILAVAWTLYHEVLFYFVFAIVIWHRAIGVTLMAVWLLSSVASLIVSNRAYPLTFLASPFHLLFGMGMVVCWLIHQNRIRFPWLFAIAGPILFIGVGVAENTAWKWLSADARSMLYGIGSAMAIAGVVTLEQEGRLRAWAPLRLIGDASYSIYLIHFPLLSVLAKVFMLFGARPHLPALLSLILMVAIVVIAGVIAHLIIERPLLEQIGSYVKRRLTPEDPPLALMGCK